VSERKQKPAKSATFRLPPDLMAKLDKYVTEQQKKTGFRVSRSSAIARFIELGLKEGR
jgi:hypothetical protein